MLLRMIDLLQSSAIRLSIGPVEPRGQAENP
jgi:hypothetical protein